MVLVREWVRVRVAVLDHQALLQDGAGLVVLLEVGEKVQLGVHGIAADFAAVERRRRHILDDLVLLHVGLDGPL